MSAIGVRFETCERGRALVFLQKLYPTRRVEDVGITARVLDLVEADIFRIPDPTVYGKRVGIYKSKNWVEQESTEYIGVLKEFHKTITRQ